MVNRGCARMTPIRKNSMVFLICVYPR